MHLKQESRVVPENSAGCRSIEVNPLWWRNLISLTYCGWWPRKADNPEGDEEWLCAWVMNWLTAVSFIVPTWARGAFTFLFPLSRSSSSSHGFHQLMWGSKHKNYITTDCKVHRNLKVCESLAFCGHCASVCTDRNSMGLKAKCPSDTSRVTQNICLPSSLLLTILLSSAYGQNVAKPQSYPHARTRSWATLKWH